MGAVDVGGDTSVRWNVDVDNLRPGSAKSEPRGERGLHQEGIDETDDGEAFTISIKLPKAKLVERARFLKACVAALKNPVKNRITLKIPIEKGNMNEDGRVNQIQIRWRSSKRIGTTS